MPSFGRIIAVALLVPLLAACSSEPVAGSANGTGAADPCGPWGCEQQARFSAASAFIGRQKGHIGLVVKDRVTGEIWRGGEPQLRSWAGSTPKLALAVTVLEEARAGTITLDPDDTAGIDAMLHVSDNEAAD